MSTDLFKIKNKEVFILPEVEGLDENILNKYFFACEQLGQTCCRDAGEWRNGSYPDLPVDIDKLPIPGGMYRGFWYWDSCFTCMQYMQIDEQYRIAEDVFKAFCWELDTFGVIDTEILIEEEEKDHPRSQMPLFIWFSDHMYKVNGSLDFLNKAYEYGKKEMQLFWMNTRIERPRYDTEYQLNHNDVNSTLLDRNVHSSFEHGWDHTPRMAVPSENWYRVLPVDLNAVLYFNEKKLAEWGAVLKDHGYPIPQEDIDNWQYNASNRQRRMEELFYNPSVHYYEDFDMDQGDRSGYISLAPSWLLWSGALSDDKVKEVAKYIMTYFIEPYNLPPVCLSDCYPKFGVGCGWGFPWSWSPVICLMAEGFAQYDFLTPITELLIDRFIQYNGGKSEKHDVDGNPAGTSVLGWSMATYFRMVQNLKLGFHPDMTEHKVVFRPYGIVDGSGGRFNIPGHSDIRIRYFKRDKVLVGADIISDEDYMTELILYFDADTDISQYQVYLDGKLLPEDRYKALDLNDDQISEGYRITVGCLTRGTAASIRVCNKNHV